MEAREARPTCATFVIWKLRACVVATYAARWGRTNRLVFATATPNPWCPAASCAASPSTRTARSASAPRSVAIATDSGRHIAATSKCRALAISGIVFIYLLEAAMISLRLYFVHYDQLQLQKLCPNIFNFSKKRFMRAYCWEKFAIRFRMKWLWWLWSPWRDATLSRWICASYADLWTITCVHALCPKCEWMQCEKLVQRIYDVSFNTLKWSRTTRETEQAESMCTFSKIEFEQTCGTRSKWL